jgi:hypothetical protein
VNWLRNLTAEVILVVGVVALLIVSIPFIFVEIVYQLGLLGWLVWSGIIYLLWRVWDRHKELRNGQK